MKKFLFISFLTLFILFPTTVLGEEYVFTTQSPFPMTYSTSISVVNEKHNLYTTDSLEDIEYLIDAGIVTNVEPMSYSTLFDYTPTDYYYSEQFNLPQVSAPFAWDKGVFGDKVRIAIIDSGLYTGASDFNSKNIIRAKDYITDTPSNSIYYCNDDVGHGTKVASIIASSHNTRGLTGIAPNVELVIFKCFKLNANGGSSGKNTYILDAIYRAVDEYDCDIINLSNGTENATILKSAIDYAEKNDVLVVASVGNHGASGAVYYPAGYDNVIGVGSVDSLGKRSSHSQRNDLVNMMAPGEGVYAMGLDSAYVPSTGTSFATPHVVAAAALAKSLNPDLTAKEITEFLYLTCDAPLDLRYCGNGTLNIQGLLTLVQSSLSENLIYSVSDKFIYRAYIPPEGFTSYLATFDYDILTGVSSYYIKEKIAQSDKFKLFVWLKDSLTPYNETISFSEY